VTPRPCQSHPHGAQPASYPEASAPQPWREQGVKHRERACEYMSVCWALKEGSACVASVAMTVCLPDDSVSSATLCAAGILRGGMQAKDNARYRQPHPHLIPFLQPHPPGLRVSAVSINHADCCCSYARGLGQRWPRSAPCVVCLQALPPLT